MGGGQPQQQVEASLDLPLPVLDLRQSSEAEVQTQIQAVIAAPFDLSQAPRYCAAACSSSNPTPTCW